MKAGIALRDITAPIGSRVADHTRRSTGVHDPLYVRALVLDDGKASVAIVCLDIVIADFPFCDSIREEIRKDIGIDLALINLTHSHSAPFTVDDPYEPFAHMDPHEENWLRDTHKAVVAAVMEAKEKSVPVTLYAGRAPVQIGFNRRVYDEERQITIMADNPNGNIVPWVNVLMAKSKVAEAKDQAPFAILFEHACHPVIVHRSSSLTGTDYCGYAIARIAEELGDGVMAMFAQGCGGNINGHSVAGGYEMAEAAGRKLGEAVLAAIPQCVPLSADELRIASNSVMLPCQEPPSEAVCDEMRKRAAEIWTGDTIEDKENLKTFDIIKEISRSGEKRALRFDTNAVMMGNEWGLVTMPHEMFCEYELWVEETAPLKHKMTFGYTNGCESYVADDISLSMGIRGGYEAGTYPNLHPAARIYRIKLPLAVGAEKLIRETVASLWE